jgi:hypothetical protein
MSCLCNDAVYLPGERIREMGCKNLPVYVHFEFGSGQFFAVGTSKWDLEELVLPDEDDMIVLLR